MSLKSAIGSISGKELYNSWLKYKENNPRVKKAHFVRKIAEETGEEYSALYNRLNSYEHVQKISGKIETKDPDQYTDDTITVVKTIVEVMTKGHKVVFEVEGKVIPKVISVTSNF